MINDGVFVGLGSVTALLFHLDTSFTSMSLKFSCIYL